MTRVPCRGLVFARLVRMPPTPHVPVLNEQPNPRETARWPRLQGVSRRAHTGGRPCCNAVRPVFTSCCSWAGVREGDEDLRLCLRSRPSLLSAIFRLTLGQFGWPFLNPLHLAGRARPRLAVRYLQTSAGNLLSLGAWDVPKLRACWTAECSRHPCADRPCQCLFRPETVACCAEVNRYHTMDGDYHRSLGSY